MALLIFTALAIGAAAGVGIGWGIWGDPIEVLAAERRARTEMEQKALALEYKLARLRENLSATGEYYAGAGKQQVADELRRLAEKL